MKSMDLLACRFENQLTGNRSRDSVRRGIADVIVVAAAKGNFFVIHPGVRHVQCSSRTSMTGRHVYALSNLCGKKKDPSQVYWFF